MITPPNDTPPKAPVQVPRRIAVDERPELDLHNTLAGQLETIDAELTQLQRRMGYLQSLRQAKHNLHVATGRVLALYEEGKGG